MFPGRTSGTNLCALCMYTSIKNKTCPRLSQSKTQDSISLITKPPSDSLIWRYHSLTSPRGPWVNSSGCTLSRPPGISHTSDEKHVFMLGLIIERPLFQIWDKSFKRSTEEAFTCSYYYNLSSFDGREPHTELPGLCYRHTGERHFTRNDK